MRIGDEVRDALAAQYALGTLRGRARVRFGRLLAADGRLQARVAFWQTALQPMADAIEPVTPPPRTWQAIESRLGFERNGRKEGLRWRTWGWAPVAIVVIVGTLFLWDPLVRQPAFAPDIEVALAAEGKSPLWKIEADSQLDRVVVHTLRDVEHDSAKSLELWLLRDRDQTPVSLGLMPTVKGQALTLRSAVPIRVGVGFAVSLEPRGGSPTGLPTGPVLYAQTFDRAT